MKIVASLARYVVALTLLIIAACQRDISDSSIDPPSPPEVEYVNANLTGRVTDQDDLPVAGAVVKAGNATAATDINGVFRFNDVRVDKNAGFVKIEKDGFFQGSRTITVNETTTNYVSIQLIKKSLSGTVSGSSGGNVTVASGGNIAFAAGSFVNPANGAAYTGAVSVSAFFIDPAAPEFKEIMPGALRGIRTTNEETGLQSFGMMAVELNGAAGEKLQLADGKLATITFPIPAGLQAQAPATIPLWWFNDTTGLWVEQGVATKQGVNYVGSVSHFSFWNCDFPSPLVDFKAVIKDQDGKALFPLKVVIRTTNDQYNTYGNGYNDSTGMIEGLIPKDKPLRISIYDRCNTELYTSAIGPFSSTADLGTITINSTNNELTISGTVVDCNAAPVTNGFVNVELEGLNYRAITTNGNFSVTLIRCGNTPATASITAYDLANGTTGDPTDIPVTTGTAQAGQLPACANNIDQFLDWTINGNVANFVYPADSLKLGVNGNEFNLSVTNNTSPRRLVSLTFNATGTGSVPVNDISLREDSATYYAPDPLSMNITEFGAPGAYISGNLSTNMSDFYTGASNIPVTIQFRIKRPN